MQYTNAKLKLIHSVSYNHTPSALAKETFFYMQGIGHFCCNKSYYTEREGFKSYLLIYTIKGIGHIHYRGKQYKVGPAQILIIDCNDYQKYYTDSQQLWEMKFIHFNGGTSREYFNMIYENYGPVIDVREDNSVLKQLDDMMEFSRTKDIFFEVKVSALIVQMLSDIVISASMSSGFGNKRPHNSLVETAVEYIEMNYSRDIMLSDIARAACSSKYNFSRIFGKITGYSPYEYLIKYRINKAKVLLKSTDISVEEISFRVGFKSSSSFIKTFRELEEMTPLKYRKVWVDWGGQHGI